MGTQIRLPEGYCPGMIVNYNLTVRATCDVAALAARYKDVLPAVKNINDLSSGNFDTITSYLEVVHFNKRIFTLTGDALQNVYVHNVQITSSEFLSLRNQFQANFPQMAKDDIFDSRMMIGGSFFSRLRDAAASAFQWLKPRVDAALKHGREAVNFAKSAVGEDSALRKYVDMADSGLGAVGYGKGRSANYVTAGAEDDSHTVMAMGRRGRAKKPAAKGKVDWRKYLQEM